MKQMLRAMICAWLLAGWVLGAEAQIVAEPGVVDLGRRTQNTVVESKVVLVNAGKEAVTIYDVQADCSCTAGTLGKQSLGAGERTELAIKTETRSYQGEVTRRVVVRTSAGDVVVPVKVTVSPYERWEVSPPFLTLAPSVRGKEAVGEVTLTHLGTDAGEVEVVSVKSEPDWVAGAVARREGKTFMVGLAKKAVTPAGHHMVKMTAVTTDAVNPVVAFNVFMSVTSAVSVKPAPLVMPVGKVGKETRLKGELLGWDGDVPPRLELSKGTATIVGTGAEGLAFEIAVTPEKAGALTQLLRIYRGEELELEVAVILRAE
ncbi:DUF1573 domain-containing protein [Nibricoccus aquaticus]|nr:DUF1573 domain-containing protein [Nibricoccus aquaticus]